MNSNAHTSLELPYIVAKYVGMGALTKTLTQPSICSPTAIA